MKYDGRIKYPKVGRYLNDRNTKKDFYKLVDTKYNGFEQGDLVEDTGLEEQYIFLGRLQNLNDKSFSCLVRRVWGPGIKHRLDYMKTCSVNDIRPIRLLYENKPTAWYRYLLRGGS